MNAKNILKNLYAEGVTLSLKNDEITLQSPFKVSDEVINRVRGHERTLLDYMKSQNAYWQARFLGYEPVHLHNMCMPNEDCGQFIQCIHGAKFTLWQSILSNTKLGNTAAIFYHLCHAFSTYSGQSDVVLHVSFEQEGYLLKRPIRFGQQGEAVSASQFATQLQQDLATGYVDAKGLCASLGIDKAENPLEAIEVVWLKNSDNTELKQRLKSNSKSKALIFIELKEGGLSLTWHWFGKSLSEYSLKTIADIFESSLFQRSKACHSVPQNIPNILKNKPDVLSIFEHVASQEPHKIALSYNGEQLSYKALASAAKSIASSLQCAGIEQGNKVVIVLPRGIALAKAILGVVYAGGVYVPISPNESNSRVQTITAQSAASAIISDCYEYNGEVARYTLSQLQETAIAPYRSVNVAAQSPLYINFSSGSTGQPKGIVCAHRGVERLVIKPNFVALNRNTEMLCAANQSFDAFVFEFWGALLNGGCVHLVAEAEFKPDHLRELFCDRVNTAFLTAALFHALVEIDPLIFDGLKQLIVGGDVVSPIHVAQVYENNAQIQIINGYGPTENTVFTSCFPIPRDWPSHIPLPIGEAINGTGVFVATHSGTPLPQGCVGEVVTVGSGLAVGYLNKQQEAGKFIEIDTEQGRLRAYKTGDLGYFDSQGALRFMGRRDGQVKINGYRVELAAINHALMSQLNVKNAHTLAIGQNSGQKLVSFVQLEGDLKALNAATKAVLLNALEARLPAHMVPSDLVYIAQLPLTLNGKIDVKSLTTNYQTREQKLFVAPSTPLQEALCSLVERVLGVDQVGIEDNFLQLGGNSIKLLKFQSLCQQELALDFALNGLFENPTVSALSKLVHRNQAIEIPKSNEPVLSFAEQRLLFIQSIKEAEIAYNTPFLFELSANFDCNALVQALEEVASRHAILKTQYRWHTHKQALPWISKQNFELRRIKVKSDEALHKMQVQYANEVFNLANELPVKLTMIATEQERYLLINIHHIVVDGWSLSILFRELAHFYGRKGPLPSLAVTYRDYASWQRSALKGEEHVTLKTFWQEYLDGAESLLLPYDKGRCTNFDYIGKSQFVTLDTELSAKLKAFAQMQNTTLYHVMLSGFFALCQKLSQQYDLIIGTPFENRYVTQTQSLIGFFVNSLPIRVKLENGDVTMLELLKLTINSVAEVRAHQALPLNDIVNAVDADFDPSRSPIFQVLFSVQAFTEQDDLPQGMRIIPHHLHTAAKYDMTILIDDSDENIVIDWNYATALFECETISRFAHMYQIALAQLIERPHTLLSTLDVIPFDERDVLLHQWSQPSKNTPLRQLRIHELFAEQVCRQGQKTALKYKDIEISYQALNERANQLARGLLQHSNRGSLQQQHIGIFQSRGVGMIVSALAVLKLGAVVVMISPEYPIVRVKAMLEDSRPLLVISDKINIENLAGHNCKSICYSDLIGVNSASDDVNTAGSIDSLAYLIYTSGTTGAPKGVQTTHRGVVSLIQNNGYVEFCADDRLVQLANPNFDMALFEIWGALCHGATLLIPDMMQPSISDILSMLSKEKITTLWLTTSLLDSLYSYAPHCFADLKYLIFGGEAANSETVRQLQASGACPQHLINGYGPTESTIVTTYRCNGFKGANVPIGKPVNTRRVYVLDSSQRLVPKGVQGELYVSGDGVAAGYLNRAELSKARFIPDVFGDDSGAMMYRTGDLVRWRSDGELEFCGRNDGQVKVRGFRIELGEIESVLLAHKHVKNAAVIDFKHQGQTHLVAYVQATLGQGQAQEIRSYIERRLPSFMHPSVYIEVEGLPLTFNGKLDIGKLPTPNFQSEREYSAPNEKFEKQLCAVFERLLGVQKVGVDDDFFELGGHSMLAMQLAHQIERLTGQSFTLRNLYSHRTVRQLSEFKPNTTDLIDPAQFMLPEDLTGEAPESAGGFKAILLTGATGFVGRYTLAQLLKDTALTVYCLVRADDQQHAAHKIKQSLQKARLWDSDFESRIKVVTGDLAKKRLGLSCDSYNTVACKVNLIIHCATYMDHLAQFEQMKAANVNSTIELIDLQQQGVPKRMVFVSTTAVLKQSALADEHTALHVQKHIHTQGYVSTKWASELLINQAQQRGFDISVVRLGLTSGCQRTGLSDQEQWLTMLMKLTSNLGVCFEDNRFQTSILPVDYVAKALTTLAIQPKVLPVYHLANAQHLYFSDLVRARNKVSETPIKLTSYARFIESLVEFKKSGNKVDGEYLFIDDMRKLAADVSANSDSEFAPISSQKTWHWFEQFNLSPPHLPEQTIAKYFATSHLCD
ncbi:non-ribosomal peptide synthetase [Pseudoalteromonas luteoviolacea]|uniref:non-ribosomal peptide synthetase n=1 Tax=Pseudoalteromonas luteoviolacea TaxID=43657 RepID=UPI000AD01957|nr:non-ribosomal peptide synthetase [Pseudoalteromonas luteoviolacea]